MPLLVGLSAGLLIVGLFMAAAGLLPAGKPSRPASRRVGRWRMAWSSWPRERRIRVGVGVALGLAITLFTGFSPALVLVPALLVMLPELLRNQPQPELELLEALDRWVRVLTASVRTGKSISDALRATRVQVPRRLVTPVTALVARLDGRWPLPEALQQMADDIDSADADAVLAALILVGERGGVGASATLAALSDSLQDRLRAMREISAERAKPMVVVRQVTTITLLALGVGLIVAPGYFTPFSTPLGQLLMVALGCGYLASLAALKQIAAPRRRERILVRIISAEASHA